MIQDSHKVYEIKSNSITLRVIPLNDNPKILSLLYDLTKHDTIKIILSLRKAPFPKKLAYVVVIFPKVYGDL